MKILKRMAAVVGGVNDGIGAVARWLTLIMVLVGATGAIVRYFSRTLGLSFNLTPLIEIQWYLFSVIFLLGAAYGVRHDVHVRVDVLYAKLGRKGQAWIDLVGSVVFLAPFCVLMLLVSWPPVRNSWQVREMSPDPGGLPRYPIKALILVSFVLLLLQTGAHVVKRVAELRGDEPDDDRRHEDQRHEPELHV